jgi:hypothetical protein
MADVTLILTAVAHLIAHCLSVWIVGRNNAFHIHAAVEAMSAAM